MRRRALLVVIFVLGIQVFGTASAYAADSCVPNPGRPRSGLVSKIDPPFVDRGTLNTWYGTYGYAGTRWHPYSYDSRILCGDPNTLIDTWIGNQLFNVGKVIVAGTNGLRYAIATHETGLNAVDHGLEAAAKSIYDNAFLPFLSLVLLIAVIWMLFKILRGALAHLATKVMWVLCALWVAASSYLLPGAYTKLVDSFLEEELNGIQQAVLQASGYQGLDSLPELLYDQVIKATWLEGEFGSATSDTAKQYGTDLLDAQAWRKSDSTANTTQADLDNKRKKYVEIANRLRESGDDGAFTGQQGSRAGTGLAGAIRGFCFAYFPLVAQLGQLLGRLIVRLLILCGPILGLAMIVYNQAAPRVARGLGKALGCCVLLTVGSTAFLWTLSLVLPRVDNDFVRLVIMGIITVIALILFRPFRQLVGMIDGITSAAGLQAAGSRMASWQLARMWGRHRSWRRREKRFLRVMRGSEHRPDTRNGPSRGEPVADDEQTSPVSRKSMRPEAWAPQRADSERVPDRSTVRRHGPARRDGEIPPRVLQVGPRVFYQGPANTLPAQIEASRPTDVQAQPRQPSVEEVPHETDVPDIYPVEDVIVPSTHENPPRPEPTPQPQQDASGYDVYLPSQDRVEHRTSARPEGEDVGGGDADPI